MAVQTTTHVSLLQKLLGYFEVAATIGTEIPEPHVQIISEIIALVTADIAKIAGGAAPLQPGGPFPVPQPQEQTVSDSTLPAHAIINQAPVIEIKKPADEPAGWNFDPITGTPIERPHDLMSPVVP